MQGGTFSTATFDHFISATDKIIAEAQDAWKSIDIRKAPALDRPLLVFHGGKDIVVPQPKEQADCIVNWASGEKE